MSQTRLKKLSVLFLMKKSFISCTVSHDTFCDLYDDLDNDLLERVIFDTITKDGSVQEVILKRESIVNISYEELLD